jgi:hypothetical protein
MDKNFILHETHHEGLDRGLTKTGDLVAALRTGGIGLYGSLANGGVDLKKTDLQIGTII